MRKNVKCDRLRYSWERGRSYVELGDMREKRGGETVSEYEKYREI